MNWIACIIFPHDEGDQQRLTHSILGLPVIVRMIRIAQKAGAASVSLLSDEPVASAIEAVVRKAGGTTDSFEHLKERLRNNEPVLFLYPSGFPEINFLEKLVERAKTKNEILIYKTVLQQPRIAWVPNARLNSISSITPLLASLESNPESSIRPMGESHWLSIESPQDIMETEQKLLKSLIKPTEGFMSRHFERKISLAITQKLTDTPLTPNQISLISIGIGLIGALGFASTERVWHVTGALLFLFHSIADGCDGEIARLKYLSSRLGAWLDFLGDNVVHCAVFSCMAVGLYRNGLIHTAWWGGGLAVFGTVASASFVFYKTMRTVEGSYTSILKGGEALEKKTQSLSKVMDAASRRDFIYLVVLAAIFGKIHWFLWLTAIGSNIFAIMVIYIYWRSKRKALFS